MRSITEKIEYFAGMITDISRKMTFGQKKKIRELLEEILSDFRELEVQNETLKARLSQKKNYNDYLTSLEKTINILQCIGFTEDFITGINKEATDFILSNYGSLTKNEPITIKRFEKYIRLINYFMTEENRYPATLKELNEKYRELQQQDQTA